MIYCVTSHHIQSCWRWLLLETLLLRPLCGLRNPCHTMHQPHRSMPLLNALLRLAVADNSFTLLHGRRVHVGWVH